MLTALMTTELRDSDHTWPLIRHPPLFRVTSLTENECRSLCKEVKVSFIAIAKGTMAACSFGHENAVLRIQVLRDITEECPVTGGDPRWSRIRVLDFDARHLSV
jgi:hypothetical protein